MPFLSRRRSALDVLNASLQDNNSVRGSNDEETRRPRTAGLAVPDHHSGQTGRTARPVSVHGMGFVSSRLSREVRREDIPDSPIHGQEKRRSKRFSMLKTRNFSESQLSFTTKDIPTQSPPPMPPLPPNITSAPSIMRSAPTLTFEEQPPRERKQVMPSFLRSSSSRKQSSELPANAHARVSIDESSAQATKKSSLRWRKKQGKSTALDELIQTAAARSRQTEIPPAYGDEDGSALAVPVPRFSESSVSEGSHDSSSDQIYGATTTTTQTVSTHTTFFKIPRRNKNRNSLFPLPINVPPPTDTHVQQPQTPPATQPVSNDTPLTSLQRSRTGSSPSKRHTTLSNHSQQTQSPLSRALQSGQNLVRRPSQRSRNSSASSPLQPPLRLGPRDRASTTSSFGRASIDTPPLLSGSTRNSFSTAGRSSLGGLLNLSRLRQDSDSKHDSQGSNSKANSFALSREALIIPEREEGDTPGKYLERLEAAVSRSMIATVLSKSTDSFAQAVLRSYTRRFPFFGEPIDMSLRKFLLEAELPKETQQVDRVIQAFADRYHECNPGVFMAPDQAYIVAFSLMMLHTDAFNKNNKRKMQKADYIKNTSGQHVSDDVLGCLYDNICYTPFVHYEDEVDINGERVLPFKSKKSKVKGPTAEGKKPSGPVDPYTLLIEQKLDTLRPAIKESITMEDPYQYLGSSASLDIKGVQRAFTHTGMLQLISARSRPTAYEDQLKTGNPNVMDSEAGVISLKVTKVGILWRKGTKKKKVRSPWQEWGAILTGSQLYLFKDAHWTKGLLQQFVSQQKTGVARTPVVFKPPIQDFKPDALIKTDDAVALVDASYNKHKHAFTLIRHGGQEEVFLADSDTERSEWLATINYAAAFRAAGVRIRGMLGVNEDTQAGRRPSATSYESSSRQDQPSHTNNSQLQRQVLAARRHVMIRRLVQSDRELAQMNKQLEDYLRDARHLMVLAPIAQKTREDVMFGAARADANIKWIRRDIWRVQCQRDILALDVQEDGISAVTLQEMVEREAEKLDDRPVTSSLIDGAADRLVSLAPPRSPTATFKDLSRRKSMVEAADSYMDDVFRSPPEISSAAQSSQAWRLPPLQLDVTTSPPLPRRDSEASSLHPASAKLSSRRTSVSQAPTSPKQHHALLAAALDPPSAVRAVTPVSSVSGTDGDDNMLATASTKSDAPAAKQSDIDDTPKSPESTRKRQSVRRSLQKTLREVQSHQGSVNKHRRAKDSESTVRSGGNEGGEVEQEGTPGLERGKGRFILHGKQASVIEFGEDWPNERMKLRRDAWRNGSGSRTPRSRTHAQSISGRTSPLVLDLTSEEDDDELADDAGNGETASVSDSVRHSFVQSAELATQYTDDATHRSSLDTSSSDDDQSFYDVASWDAETSKRNTIIGAPAGFHLTAQGHTNGGAEHEDDTLVSAGRGPRHVATNAADEQSRDSSARNHDDWLTKGFDDGSRKKAIAM